MFVLDTNVLLEATKSEPSGRVRVWLNEQVADILYICSVTQAELLFGVADLPDGARKRRLTAAVDGALALFEDRVLAFDEKAARRYAELAASARRRGHTLPLADGYIAAVAAVHGFTVVSRDTAPFVAAGVPIISPWTRKSRKPGSKPGSD